MKSVLKEFKKFILRGNVVDLAIAVVIGAAFTSVVTAIVRDFITPLIAAIYGKTQFSDSYFMIHNSKFLYGDFLNALISFLIVAAVIFFMVVQPINKLVSISQRRKTPEDPATRKCPECLSEISRKATRCAFCTSKISPDKA